MYHLFISNFNMLLKIVLKIVGFICLVVVLQYLYFHQGSKWFSSIKPPSRMLHLVNRDMKSPFDLVYVGSSINFTRGKLDKDKRDIVEMVNDIVGECTMLDVSRGGNNVELYDEIIKYIENRKKKELEYVFEISIRTFSPVYDEPANAMSLKQDEILFKENLLSAFYHPLQVFDFGFNIMDEKQFNNLPIYDGDSYVGKLNEIVKTGETNLNVQEIAAKKFLINYMGHIETDHPKISALKKILEYLNEHKLKSTFVIMPENYLKGEEYYPKKFLKRYSRNVAYVKDVITQSGSKVLDLSQLLDSSFFTHVPIYPNGHLNERGRRTVAEKISEVLDCN